MRWLPPVLYRSRGKFFDKFPRGHIWPLPLAGIYDRLISREKRYGGHGLL